MATCPLTNVYGKGPAVNRVISGSGAMSGRKDTGCGVRTVLQLGLGLGKQGPAGVMEARKLVGKS